jgi:hypothetical protein
MKRLLRQSLLTCIILLTVVPMAESSYFQHIKIYVHPELKAGKVSVHSVGILPFQVQNAREAAKIERALTSVLKTVLGQHGCTVVKSVFTEEAQATDTELKYTFADVERQFDMLDSKILKEPQLVQEGRYTMGDVVNKLDPEGTADALVFVRAGMQEKSHRALLETFTNLVFNTEIAVVDARTGNVLYYANLIDENPIGVSQEPEKRLVKPITKVFNEFPGTANGK